MILISKTYEIVTEESAENGEASERGFIFENAEFSFSELVKELKEYTQGSSSHMTGSPFEWVSTEHQMDPISGESEAFSLHYGRGNPAKNEKYWRKALAAAGFVRQERKK